MRAVVFPNKTDAAVAQRLSQFVSPRRRRDRQRSRYCANETLKLRSQYTDIMKIPLTNIVGFGSCAAGVI